MYQQQTPKGPLSQSAIRRIFFRQISRAQFDQMFKDKNYIGSGSQGQVYKAISVFDQPVAIKYFRKEYMGSELINYIRSQIQALQGLEHQNILQLIQCYQIAMNANMKKFCIVTQYCEANLTNYQTLYGQQFSALQKMKICYQMISGIKAAHQKRIIHRDIKPDNILIKNKQTLTVKIADFGCSKMRTQGDLAKSNIAMTKVIGTPLYSDPNISQGSYTAKCDIYSAGLVIIFLFCGRQFFEHCMTKQQLMAEKKRFTQNIQKNCRQFLQNLEASDLSEKIKQFLVQIACFTLEQRQDDRHNAKQLQEFIANRIKDFERQELYKTKIEPQIKQEQFISPIKQVDNQQLFKKKRVSPQQKDIHSKNSAQQQELKTKTNKIKSFQTVQQNQRFEEINKTNISKLSQISGQSKGTNQTTDKSSGYLNNKLQSHSPYTKKNNNYEQSSNKSGSFKQISNNGQQNPFKTPKRQSQNQGIQKKISFISSQSNQMSQKLSPTKNSFKNRSIFRNLKMNSSILQSRSSIINKNFLCDSALRQSRIDQNQKTLDDRQKLCAQRIRYKNQMSHLNNQCQIARRVLLAFRQIKQNFQNINKICQLQQIYFAKGQQQSITFLFFYLYAGKLKDIYLFVNGRQSKLKLQYVRGINTKKKDLIQQMIQSQLSRIKKNINHFANDLNRKANLIKPRLSDTVKDSIKNVLYEKDMLFNIAYSQTQTKTEVRNMMNQIYSKIKNQKDKKIMTQLINSVGKMCI